MLENNMAAGYSRTDELSRVRREQRMRGKPSTFAGLRIVLAATAITVAILLSAFGVIGMLLLARPPQEPIATRLDPTPPVAQQVETPPAVAIDEAATSTHEKQPESDDLEKKAVKTLRVIAPPAPAAEQTEAVAEPPKPAMSDPETTATIPPPQAQPKEQVPQPAVQQQRRPARQHQHARRPAPDSQGENPLYQLFGIRKYR